MTDEGYLCMCDECREGRYIEGPVFELIESDDPEDLRYRAVYRFESTPHDRLPMHLPKPRRGA